MSGIDLQREREKSLIEALQQGESHVLGLLYDAYAPVMLGVITRIIPNKDVAEEVLHETFVAIWDRIGIYDSSKNRFLIWGLAIARGIAMEAVKTGKYRHLINGKPVHTIENGQLAKKQTAELISSLEPAERTILDLIYIQGKSCEEVTAQLGITIETLKVNLKKAFIHLKAERSA